MEPVPTRAVRKRRAASPGFIQLACVPSLLLVSLLPFAGCRGSRAEQDRPPAAAEAPQGKGGYENPQDTQRDIASVAGDGAQAMKLLTTHLAASRFPAALDATDSDLWRRMAPEPDRVTLRSSEDEAPQRALFYNSGSDRDKPLLVVLHSWRTNYLQNISIPYAHWAVDNDWVFIHPDLRGPYDEPDAICPELALQDAIDAVDYAMEHASVDPSRIYLTGYSGGATLALMLAARYPERWTAVAAWAPVVEPENSPSPELAGAKGAVPVLLAVGTDDMQTPPSHVIRAYNMLVHSPERLPAEEATLSTRARASTAPAPAEPWLRLFEPVTGPPVLVRRADTATVVMYEGGDDVIYNPGLAWLASQQRPTRHP